MSRESKNNKWRARIQVGGLRINIGRYDDEIEAALCYDAYAVELFKSFAKTNTYDDKSEHSESDDEEESPSDENRNDVDWNDDCVFGKQDILIPAKKISSFDIYTTTCLIVIKETKL